ncbi:hypothetical protein ACNKHR_26590 [Shigella flexneri]
MFCVEGDATLWKGSAVTANRVNQRLSPPTYHR